MNKRTQTEWCDNCDEFTEMVVSRSGLSRTCSICKRLFPIGEVQMRVLKSQGKPTFKREKAERGRSYVSLLKMCEAAKERDRAHDSFAAPIPILAALIILFVIWLLCLSPLYVLDTVIDTTITIFYVTCFVGFMLTVGSLSLLFAFWSTAESSEQQATYKSLAIIVGILGIPFCIVTVSWLKHRDDVESAKFKAVMAQHQRKREEEEQSRQEEFIKERLVQHLREGKRYYLRGYHGYRRGRYLTATKARGIYAGAFPAATIQVRHATQYSDRFAGGEVIINGIEYSFNGEYHAYDTSLDLVSLYRK